MAYQTLAELNTGDVLPETWVDQVKENFEAIRGSAVTTLPTGYDNQVVRYKPLGAGSSPTWMCVFDTELNGGVGAWAVIGGGAPIEAYAASASTTGTAFGNLTGGPSLVIPVDGLYDFEVGAELRNSGANWNMVQPSALTDSDSLCLRYQFSSGNVISPGFRRYAGLEISAGTVVARARVTAGTGEFFNVVFAAYPRELRP